MKKNQSTLPTSLRKGLISALFAYFIWGLLPIFWKTLGNVPPWELLAWRVFGCGILAWVFLLYRGRLALIDLVKKRKISKKIFLHIFWASLLILLNWGLFIWAVSEKRILEASLGYYINPLINVILGIIFFSETLGRRRLTALILAFIGVVIMTLAAGTFPWVSIILALCFGLYGMITKSFPAEMDSIESLGWVMAILSPAGAVYLIFLWEKGSLHLTGFGSLTTVLLLLAGFVTLVPLWLFGTGAKKLSLGMLGFMQYIAPTLMLILGIFVYGESFDIMKGIAFVFILVALGLYSSTLIRGEKKD
jgi:chloramphenicol-sensitive protein RarD